MKILLIIFTLSLALYCLFALIMYITQRKQIYLPGPESDAPGYDSFLLPVDRTADGAEIRLKIWRLHPDCGPALVYFGGNAEEVSANCETFDRIFPALAVYLVNYRGYGGSGGNPTEKALCQDALTIFDHLTARHVKIAVVGRSLGSAIAIHLAAQRPVARMLLVTPFASLTGVVRSHYFFLPVSWLLKDRYDNLAKIEAVSAPTTMIIAGNDEIVPRRESELLQRAFSGKECRMVIIPGAGHNDLDLHPLYRQTLAGFASG
ncbi:MAG: alpha/beta hydrolase [Deltaproteobacteria bacterium]|nr:alpha/beta hydrolase [Deltaproteobacteria bacterium]